MIGRRKIKATKYKSRDNGRGHQSRSAVTKIENAATFIHIAKIMAMKSIRARDLKNITRASIMNFTMEVISTTGGMNSIIRGLGPLGQNASISSKQP